MSISKTKPTMTFVQKKVLFIPLYAIILFSCTKQQWKETANLEFEVSCDSKTVSLEDDLLYIDTLIRTFDYIEIEANRLQSSNIDLNLNGPVKCDFIEQITSKKIQFEIPQGTYDKFDVFLKSTGIGLELNGRYYSSQMADKKIVLTINSGDLEQIPVKDNDGSTTILFEKDQSRKLLLTINTSRLFQNINPAMWNAAIPSFVFGESAIVINANSNETLYIPILNNLKHALNAEMIN
jgi:hypothetical protein